MSDATARFTILTGWLGAGKTSTLNRVLGAPHGRRIAVLVNELGRISIDTKLILRRGGDVLELAGGCICCKVDLKSDLWDGIDEVITRSRPEHVVLETTGIAEPAAILANLGRVRAFTEGRITAGGVVAVVDAEAAAATLDRREEAREQVIAADRLLLTKLDVASAAAVAQAHARLDAIQPRAERAAFPADDAGALALTAWLLAAPTGPERFYRAPRVGPDGSPVQPGIVRRLGSASRVAHAGGQLTAVAFVDPAPLVAARLEAVIGELGDRLVRAKGWIHLAGEPRRGFLEKAGARTALTLGEPWGTAAPETELVLIGDDLDEAAVRRALHACASAG
jgi:G3E family GTPase